MSCATRARPPSSRRRTPGSGVSRSTQGSVLVRYSGSSPGPGPGSASAYARSGPGRKAAGVRAGRRSARPPTAAKYSGSRVSPIVRRPCVGDPRLDGPGTVDRDALPRRLTARVARGRPAPTPPRISGMRSRDPSSPRTPPRSGAPSGSGSASAREVDAGDEDRCGDDGVVTRTRATQRARDPRRSAGTRAACATAAFSDPTPRACGPPLRREARAGATADHVGAGTYGIGAAAPCSSTITATSLPSALREHRLRLPRCGAPRARRRARQHRRVAPCARRPAAPVARELSARGSRAARLRRPASGAVGRPAAPALRAGARRTGERAGAAAALPATRPRTWIACSTPMPIIVVISDVPPTLTSGSGMPVTGAIPIVMPTFTKTWKRSVTTIRAGDGRAKTGRAAIGDDRGSRATRSARRAEGGSPHRRSRGSPRARRT